MQTSPQRSSCDWMREVSSLNDVFVIIVGWIEVVYGLYHVGNGGRISCLGDDVPCLVKGHADAVPLAVVDAVARPWIESANTSPTNNTSIIATFFMLVTQKVVTAIMGKPHRWLSNALHLVFGSKIAYFAGLVKSAI